MKVFSFLAVFCFVLFSLLAMDLPPEEKPKTNFKFIQAMFIEHLEANQVSADIMALFCRFEDLLLLTAGLEQTINNLQDVVAMNQRRLEHSEAGLKKHVEYAEGHWEDTIAQTDLSEEAKGKELSSLRAEHQNFLKIIEGQKTLILNNQYEISVALRHKSIYLKALEKISILLQENMMGIVYDVQADDFGLEPGELIDIPIYPLDCEWESRKVMIMRTMRKPSLIEYSLRVEDAEEVAGELASKGCTVLVVKYDPFIVELFDEELPVATYDAYNPIPDSRQKFGVLHMKHPDISSLCPKRTVNDTERERDLIPNLKGMRILRRMVYFQFSFALDYDYDTIVIDLGYPAAQFFCSSVYHSIYQHYIKLFSGTEIKKVIFANNGTQDQIIVDDEDTEEFSLETASTEEFELI